MVFSGSLPFRSETLEDIKAKGYLCRSCNSYETNARCVCGNKAVREVHLGEVIVEKVIADEGAIEFTDNKELRKEGGIGAFLRFKG
ncbi:TPA: hypothetical protein DDW69_01970 [candidate division CPR2 bacterium]|nr:MAG: hypothetical protein A2Y27_03475 [candidate division CPR2 bacterium GWD1_39_7]OGB72267.1 MAG: hypothetical protein A2Y26_05365 [candidate division CPR2 bacterium GWD2_39_7]HBG81586.1 hypothetical protein [candidate division CPR2 bacterium]HCL99449.1 hypothetical protein [candidate division CPR2 bacterium]